MKFFKVFILIFAILTISVSSFLPQHVNAQESSIYDIEKIFITKDSVPAEGARVNAFEDNQITNKNGIALFQSVKKGNYTINVVLNDKRFTEKIDINSSQTEIKLIGEGILYVTDTATIQSLSQTDSSNTGNILSWFIIIAGIFLFALGVKLFADRVKMLDYKSRIMSKRIELSLGAVASFVLVLGLFGQIFFVSNPKVSNNTNSNAAVVTTTPPSNPDCLCAANICNNSCAFDKESGVTYSQNIMCNREKGLSETESSMEESNNFCRDVKRTKGDTNNDNIIEVLDYMYYVRVVNGGLIPTYINADFNGDSIVSRSDRNIVISNL